MGKSNTMHSKHRQIVRFQTEALPKLEQSNKLFPKKKLIVAYQVLLISQSDDKNR